MREFLCGEQERANDTVREKRRENFKVFPPLLCHGLMGLIEVSGAKDLERKLCMMGYVIRKCEKEERG